MPNRPRTLEINVSDTVTVRDGGTLLQRRHHFERRPLILAALLLLTLASSGVGLFVAGLPGAALGLVLGLLGFLLPPARTRVVETDRTSF